MCFSAEVSFAVAGVLLPAGVYCTSVAARKQPACLPLAITPIIFSLQQFAEGLVWVGLARGDAPLVRVSALAFLAAALGFWPFWASLCMLFLEKRRWGRRCLGAAALLGLMFGCALYVPLVLNPEQWLRVREVHHSIRYNPEGLPAFDLVPHEWWDVAYGALVLFPFFLASPDGRFVAFRILLAASAVVSFLLFRYAFVSVWCFFAALLSAQLCWTFSTLGTREERAGAAPFGRPASS